MRTSLSWLAAFVLASGVASAQQVASPYRMTGYVPPPLNSPTGYAQSPASSYPPPLNSPPPPAATYTQPPPDSYTQAPAAANAPQSPVTDLPAPSAVNYAQPPAPGMSAQPPPFNYPQPAPQDTSPWHQAAPCAPQAAPGQFASGDQSAGYWVQAEYLLWFLKGPQVPPLVSTGSAASQGSLDRGAVSVFGGPSAFDNDYRSGGRFRVGAWLDDEDLTGIELGYFFLAPGGKNFSLSGDGSAGSQVVGRPFYNPILGREDAEGVSLPGTLSGQVGVSTSSFLQGGDASFLCNLCCSCCYSIQSLAGFRYFELGENITVTEDLMVLPTVPTTGGTHFNIFDNFSTHNRFYGGQVGLRGEMRSGRLLLGFTGKVALGVMAESVTINGATTTTSPDGTVTTQPGGLLALPTNMGNYYRNRLAYIPEGILTAGYQVTPNVRLWAGYDFLYCNAVVRPGDQIDRVVNPTLLPSNNSSTAAQGPARPEFLFQGTDFWAQGLTCGLELRF